MPWSLDLGSDVFRGNRSVRPRWPGVQSLPPPSKTLSRRLPFRVCTRPNRKFSAGLTRTHRVFARPEPATFGLPRFGGFVLSWRFRARVLMRSAICACLEVRRVSSAREDCVPHPASSANRAQAPGGPPNPAFTAGSALLMQRTEASRSGVAGPSRPLPPRGSSCGRASHSNGSRRLAVGTHLPPLLWSFQTGGRRAVRWGVPPDGPAVGADGRLICLPPERKDIHITGRVGRDL